MLKDKIVHVAIRESTRAHINRVRVLMRHKGLGQLPRPVSGILEQEWTADTMVLAGMMALFEHLSSDPKPDQGNQPQPAKTAAKKGSKR